MVGGAHAQAEKRGSNRKRLTLATKIRPKHDEGMGVYLCVLVPQQWMDAQKVLLMVCSRQRPPCCHVLINVCSTASVNIFLTGNQTNTFSPDKERGWLSYDMMDGCIIENMHPPRPSSPAEIV